MGTAYTSTATDRLHRTWGHLHTGSGGLRQSQPGSGQDRGDEREAEVRGPEHRGESKCCQQGRRRVA